MSLAKNILSVLSQSSCSFWPNWTSLIPVKIKFSHIWRLFVSKNSSFKLLWSDFMVSISDVSRYSSFLLISSILPCMFDWDFNTSSQRLLYVWILVSYSVCFDANCLMPVSSVNTLLSMDDIFTNIYSLTLFWRTYCLWYETIYGRRNCWYDTGQRG